MNSPAGGISGVVRSFVDARAYGFIDGVDGQSYFVHLKDVQGGVPLVNGQDVTFIPKPSPRGSKATQVVPGQVPTPIYLDPDDFIVSKFADVKGVEVVCVVGEGWSESNDPNLTRRDLIERAKSFGGNAITNAHMERYTKQEGCSNYKFTMHRMTGQFVVVKKVVMTTDPAAIAECQQRQQDFFDWLALRNAPAPEPEPRESFNISTLVPPAKLKFVAMLLWGWACTVGKILWLTGRYFAKKVLAKIKSLQKA